MVCCNDYLISEGALWSNASLNIRLSCTNDFVRGCYNVIMYNVIIRLNRILIVEIHLTGDNSDNQLTTPVLGSELNGWRHFDSWYKSYKGIHGWQRLWELFRWSNSKLEVLSLPQRKRNDEHPISTRIQTKTWGRRRVCCLERGVSSSDPCNCWKIWSW